MGIHVHQLILGVDITGSLRDRGAGIRIEDRRLVGGVVALQGQLRNRIAAAIGELVAAAVNRRGIIVLKIVKLAGDRQGIGATGGGHICGAVGGDRAGNGHRATCRDLKIALIEERVLEERGVKELKPPAAVKLYGPHDGIARIYRLHVCGEVEDLASELGAGHLALGAAVGCAGYRIENHIAGYAPSTG